VLDLDHTLWGGVLGEDGPRGVTLGEEYPGNVYKEFQRTLLSYRDRGILLAIASKNIEADVLEVLEHHPDMVLRPEHFAARQIHWQDKATSLAAIARELRIGTDALAFFDDSAVEREWVRSRMPEVCVVEVPRDPLGYAAALEASGAFDSIALTREDRSRANEYRAAKDRQAPSGDLVSVEEFLRSLAMRIQIGSIDAKSVARVVQLILKTNQFNLTGRRRTQPEVERMIRNGAIALWARLADRHGDSGLIGVALAQRESLEAFALDTFLISCRALGRKVETALLAAVARLAVARGASWLMGTFIPTPKNAPAATFFPDHGFEPVAGESGRWRLHLPERMPLTPGFYSVVNEA
jgi:FkbH-like protein